MLIERVYFAMCLGLGRLLRSARYSKTRVVDRDVRKHRLFFAPLLVWMSGPLIKILDTGVRVLPQRAWEARERQLYAVLYGASLRAETGGVLVLPRIAGVTLATLLEDRALEVSLRKKAIELAVVALVELHQFGFTHGDAMAENVLVDLHAGVANWVDFENSHDSRRSVAWRRADDVRALLATCLSRTDPESFADTLEHILDVYDDEAITQLVAASFARVAHRPLAFHLGQASLSFQRFRDIARLLGEPSSSSRKRLRHSVVITG